MRGVTSKKKASTAGLSQSMQSLYLKHLEEQRIRYGSRTVVLMQVGVFFEMYDVLTVETGEWAANVQSIAELCGSSVQPKSTSDPGKQTFFWGFPESALEKYEPMITAAGYSVVVIIQKKDAIGEVSSRAIDHVSSPGIFCGSNNNSFVRREEQILLSVYVEPWVSRTGHKHWYLSSSSFDVSTGKTITMETNLTLINDKPVLDIVTPFWSVYPPAEVCFYWSSSELSPPTESHVLTMFAGASIGRTPLIHIYVLDSKKENSVVEDRMRSEFLKDIYHHDSSLTIEEYLGITHYPFARKSLYHLLQFVKDHNPSFLTMLHEHSVWTPEDNVLLGNSALEQLGMLPLSQDREYESLLAWLQKAATAMGRRTLRERILKPLADIELLEDRQIQIAALRDNGIAGVDLRNKLEAVLRGSHDLARLHRRFQLGNGTTDDLLQLLRTYDKAEQLIKLTQGFMFEPFDSKIVSFVQTLLSDFSSDRILRSKEQVNDSIAVGSFHPWKRGLFPALDTIEDEWLASEREMLEFKTQLEELLSETNVIRWELKDDAPFTFLTTQRRAAVIATSAKKRLKMDITFHKRGSAGQMYLECDTLMKANTKAVQLRDIWKAAIYTQWIVYWKSWSEQGICSGVLDMLVQWLGELDATCTLARLSDQYCYVRPKYIESTDAIPAGVCIEGLRHPIIERVHSSTPYISHNIQLGFETPVYEKTAVAKKGILLYGVNASGKSSLGKAIGLSVIMAQSGMPVAASNMTLIPYTGIFTRILGNDNLWAGMSSFVVEMTEFRSILRSAGPRTLVIGDELCAGTETASASSIVAAGVKTLCDRGSQFIFATHLHELSEIPEIAEISDLEFYHLTVRPSTTNKGSLIYDRQLMPGTGSPMYGLEVCRGLDMDSTFLTTAFELRKKYYSDEMRMSQYNAKIVVNKCEVCGSNKNMEVHHIVHQAAADSNGFIENGRHKNNASNLTTLCESCHIAHHKDQLKIKGWVDTTRGRILDYEWI